MLYTFLEEMSINKIGKFGSFSLIYEKKISFYYFEIKREDKICLLYMKILYGIKAKVTGFTLFVKM